VVASFVGLVKVQVQLEMASARSTERASSEPGLALDCPPNLVLLDCPDMPAGVLGYLSYTCGFGFVEDEWTFSQNIVSGRGKVDGIVKVEILDESGPGLACEM
jgi:hypothetical protein